VYESPRARKVFKVVSVFITGFTTGVVIDVDIGVDSFLVHDSNAK
jgi:hypothetical protein